MKTKEEAAQQSVLSYFVRQNRPYSVQDVFQNMGKDLGKTLVGKTIDALVIEGKLREKIYGKQKVYVANQSLFPDVNESEIKAMDETIVKLNGQVGILTDSSRKLESELRTFNEVITTEEATSRLSDIYPVIEKLNNQVSKLKEGRVLVSKQDREKAQNKRQNIVKEWRKRKRIASDILNSILEGYPKSKKQLFEDIGIETDEECGVKIPEK